MYHQLSFCVGSDLVYPWYTPFQIRKISNMILSCIYTLMQFNFSLGFVPVQFGFNPILVLVQFECIQSKFSPSLVLVQPLLSSQSCVIMCTFTYKVLLKRTTFVLLLAYNLNLDLLMLLMSLLSPLPKPYIYYIYFSMFSSNFKNNIA